MVCLKYDKTCTLGHGPAIQSPEHSPRPSASCYAVLQLCAACDKFAALELQVIHINDL